MASITPRVARQDFATQYGRVGTNEEIRKNVGFASAFTAISQGGPAGQKQC